MEIDEACLKFRSPCSIMVAGPSNSGKTTLCIKLVQQSDYMFSEPPAEIFWCYAEPQPAYSKLPSHVEMIQGLPPMDRLRANPSHHKLCILDDMMTDYSKSSAVTELATRGCHHMNCSLLLIVQNAFYGQRTVRINMTYLILLKNPTDKTQVENLSRQMYKNKTLAHAYIAATEKSHSALLVDLHQKTDERLRLRSGILKEDAKFVYVPRNL